MLKHPFFILHSPFKLLNLLVESSKKILDIIFLLNQDVFDQLDEGEYEELYPDLFTLTSDGNCDIVKFMNVTLWSSLCDDREFLRDVEDYEPLDEFLKKKANKLLKIIRKVKL